MDDCLKTMSAEETDKDIKGMLRPLKEFNEQEHHIMCSELKQLYTAITRARVRVVIYDEDPAARAPLFYYFERLGLCDKVRILEDDAAPGFVKETSAEEWRVRGKNLMDNKVFELAAQCFKKSGDKELENRAIAMTLLTRDEPQLRREGKHKELALLFVEAAERLFAGRSSTLKVAECFHKGGAEALRSAQSSLAKRCFELAGIAYISSLPPDVLGDQRILKKAVSCLQRAEQFDKCAELLVSRGRVRHALKFLYERHEYDRALELTTAHPELHFAPPHELCRENLLRLCASAHALNAKNKVEGSWEKFKGIIKQMSAEDAESQLLRHGYKELLIERLVESGNFRKAARLMSNEDKREEAARILCDTNPEPSMSDLAFGTELLLAQLVCEANVEHREAVLQKAQQLQSRLRNMASHSNDPQAMSLVQAQTVRLELCKHRLSNRPDSSGREAHDALAALSEQLRPADERQDALSLLSERFGSHAILGSSPTVVDNALARVMCGCESFALRQFQVTGARSLSCPDVNAVAKDALELIDGIDGILTSVASKEASMHEYLRLEEFFGISWTTGMCTISRCRKDVMDWMLKHDEGLDSISPTESLAVNPEGDFVLDPAYFKSSLAKYLLVARRRVLTKTSLSLRASQLQLAHLGDKMCEHHCKTSECNACAARLRTERLQNLLLYALMCLTDKKSAEDKHAAQQICVGDAVELRALKGKKSVGNGMEAVVEKVHRFEEWKEMQETPKTGSEITNTPLAAALQHKRKFTQDELESFGLDPKLTCNGFIKAGEKCFAAATLFSVSCTQETTFGKRVELRLDEENLRLVDILSRKSFREVCRRLSEIFLSGESPGPEYKLTGLLPAFLTSRQVELVQRGLRDHLWSVYSQWSKVPVKDRSALILLDILMMLDRMGDKEESMRMLTRIDRDCSREWSAVARKGAPPLHPFSDIVQAHRDGEKGLLHIQALLTQRFIKAHLSAMIPQAHVLRMVLNALALSLVDLARLDVRTAAERVRFDETPFAVLLPASVARWLCSSAFGRDKKVTGEETILCAMQNLHAILQISREDSQVCAKLPPSTVAATSHLISVVSLNHLVTQANDFPSPHHVRWSRMSSESWEELNKLMGTIQHRLTRQMAGGRKACQAPRVYTLPTLTVSCDDPESLLQHMTTQGDPLVLLKSGSAGFTQEAVAPTAAVLWKWIEAGLQGLHSRTTVDSRGVDTERAAITAPPSTPASLVQEAVFTEMGSTQLSVDAQEFVPRSEDWAMSDGFAEDVRQGKLEVEREERAVRIILAFFRRVRWKKRRRDKAAARAGRVDTAAGSAQAGALAAGNIEQFDRFQRLRRYVRAFSCVCAHARTCTETLRPLHVQACTHAHTHTHTHLSQDNCFEHGQHSDRAWYCGKVLMFAQSALGHAEFEATKIRMFRFRKVYEVWSAVERVRMSESKRRKGAGWGAERERAPTKTQMCHNAT